MSGEAPATAYPTRWETDVVLADGGTVHLRPITPADRERVRAFHGRQSRESIYFRYFSPMPELSDRELDRLVQADYVARMAFIALIGDDVVAMASYDVWRERNEAEVAFFVDDEHHGRGLATVLLEYLAEAARENGFDALTAMVLPSNRRMLSVFRAAGFETETSFEDGVVEVRMDLTPTERSRQLIEERERISEARSIHRLLFPASVAVIGVGREPGGIGREVFQNLRRWRDPARIFAVNPQGGEVDGVPVYRSIEDLPGDVDLAVVAVPAKAVGEVVEQCARKRVHGLLVISAGFESVTIDGRPAQDVIVERALRFGMRVIGPESLGVINTAPDAPLHATFADVAVEAGVVGFVTQSGTLGIAAIEHAARHGIGISSFVDIGSRVDVSGNDLLQYWSEDEATEVVLLYLERLGNPRKFTRIARRLARDKPIVAVKSGRSVAPEVEDPSGGLASLWPTDATADALLAQSGVIRVDTPTELFDVARVLTTQPVPRGRRVEIVSNAKGATLLTADACLRAELTLHGEPVRLRWDAGPADYRDAVRRAMRDPDVDAVIAIYAPPLRERRLAVARAIKEASQGAGKPVLATFLGAEVGTAFAGELALPLFGFPSEAAHTLGLIAPYGEWLSRPAGVAVSLDHAHLEAVRARVALVLDGSAGGRWLDRDETADLLTAAGVPIAAHRVVTSAASAVTAAEQLGYPVVLKAVGVERYHRGEAGGVALDLHGGAAVSGAYERMHERLGEAMDVVVVQRMIGPGVNVLVGAHQHPSYGAVLNLGLGGSVAAANPRLPTRVLPLTDVDAAELVASSPVGTLVGAEAADGAATQALERFLLHLAAVLDAVPEIGDVLLNPVIVGAEGACVADAWVRVAPYRWDEGPAVRRLT